MKEKKKYVRTTLHITNEEYIKLERMANKRSKTKLQIMTDLTNEIVSGKYDKFLNQKESFRSTGIFQDDTKRLKEYLKDKNTDVTVTEILMIALKRKRV
ncbi:hypothetical protein [Enterococcus sp. N249-2]